MTKTSFAEKLERLRVMFLSQMQNDMPQLQASHQQLLSTLASEQSANGELLDTLHHLLHKIKGSAGTFGYSDLADCAQRLETQIKTWIKQGFNNLDNEINTYQQDYEKLIVLHEQLQQSTPASRD